MTDSFLHEHQSAIDSQIEEKAIRELQDAGIYPDPVNTQDKEEQFKDYLEFLDFPEENTTGWFIALDMLEEDYE